MAESINPKNIAGYKTRINVGDISTTGDNSITITPEGDVSQTIKNNPEQYYGASVFGYSKGAFPAQKETVGTSIQTVVADVTSTPGKETPYITFETTALNGEVPSITLYWTATSTAPDTVFATGSSKITTAPGSAFNWAPIGNANTFHFEPNSNYTKAYIGGSFTDLGKAKAAAPAVYGYRGYGTINLTGGPSLEFIGKSGQQTNFGPLGSAVSATAVDYANGFVNYYGGGYGGIQLVGAPSTTNCINKILEVKISDYTYVCLGGKFTSFNIGLSTASKGLSTINSTNLFIFEKNNPRKWARFNFPGQIYDMEFDENSHALLIGSDAIGGVASTGTMFVLSGLSGSSNLATSVQAKIATASAFNVSKLSRLYLDKGGPSVPLWTRFNTDQAFNANVFTGIKANGAIYKLKYLNLGGGDAVVFAGGNHDASAVTPDNAHGLTCHYCHPSHASRGKRTYNVAPGVSDSVKQIWSPKASFVGTTTVTDIYIEDRTANPLTKIMYVCGDFLSILDENGTTKANPYIVAFDLGKGIYSDLYPGQNYLNTNLTYPTFLNKWKPKPNGLVASMDLDSSGDPDVLYILGDFTTIISGNATIARNYLAALNTADPNEAIGDSVYGWNVNMAQTATSGNKIYNSIYAVPNASPLSGIVIVHNTMTTLDLIPVNRVARTVKYKQSIANFQEQAVTWQLGCKLLNGSDLTIGSEFVSASSAAKQENEIVTTEFSYEKLAGLDAFKGSNNTGNFLRFLITPKTAGVSDYNGRTWVIGARVNHNP